MNRLTLANLAIGIALLLAIPAHAQDTTVIVKDPDPPTPAIKETTVTTTTEHAETVTPARPVAHATTHRTVHHYHYPVHHHAVAYHPPVTHHSIDTQTTTKTTVITPAHDPDTVVSEDANGTVSVTTTEPGVEVQPADQDDQQH